MARIGISGITVMTTEGHILAHPKPTIGEINMSTTADQVRESAAAEGVPVVSAPDNFKDRNGKALTGAALTARQRLAASGGEIKAPKPKGNGVCLFSGQPTSGGRFLPGGDAKLKSALVRRFRDERVEIADQGMSDELVTAFATGELSTSQGAYNRLVDLGWEKYATIPEKSKPKAPTDGLGVGNYTVSDEGGALLQRVANDEAAIEWAENNGYALLSSNEHGIVVEPDEDDEDTDDEDDEDDESDDEE